MMHGEDTARAGRVHPLSSEVADSFDELAALISTTEALPETVRSTMLALLDSCAETPRRLEDFSGKLLRIRRWDENFEVAQTRRIKGVPKWIALPVKHDGARYRRLIEGANGAARFGVWVGLCQVAMKCPTRGVLADEDGPLSLEDLALKTGIPLLCLLDALPPLMRIGWLELDADDPASPTTTTPDDGPDEPTVATAEPLVDQTAGLGSVSSRKPSRAAAGTQNAGTQGREAQKPDLIVPAELARMVELWNSFPPGMAASVTTAELPGLCATWERIEQDTSAGPVRELLHDAEAVIDDVRASFFLHGKPWFTLAWLLKRERDGPLLNVQKLAAGQYRDDPAEAAGVSVTLEALQDF